MNMQFYKFSDIINHYRISDIEKTKELYPDLKCQVFSKVDGANFSFITDGVSLRVASRNQFVTGQFNNCQTVIDTYCDSVAKLFEYLELTIGVDHLQVYGELFGDKILGRIKYSPTVDFVAFDIRVNGEYCSAEDLTEMREYLAGVESPLQFLMPLYEGTLDECINYCESNLVYNSYIPALFNTKYKDVTPNHEEGYVIRPNTVAYIGSERVIFKVKNEKFLEKTSAKKEKTVVIIDQDLLNTLLEYVTESRVYSVISKATYELNWNNFGKVISDYVADVLIEAEKDKVNLETLDKAVKKALSAKVVELIKPLYNNLGK